MRPIKTDATNFVYHLDGGTEENDLPCMITEQGCFSTWAFEDDDEPLSLGRLPVSDVRLIVGVQGDYATVSEHLVLVAQPCGHDPMEKPQWYEHPGGEPWAIAIFPMSDEQRLQVAGDRAFDLFIGARPIPPVMVWTARVGPCERCGKTMLHPCPCGAE
jgi:hypothetical protein